MKYLKLFEAGDKKATDNPLITSEDLQTIQDIFLDLNDLEIEKLNIIEDTHCPDCCNIEFSYRWRFTFQNRNGESVDIQLNKISECRKRVDEFSDIMNEVLNAIERFVSLNYDIIFFTHWDIFIDDEEKRHFMIRVQKR